MYREVNMAGSWYNYGARKYHHPQTVRNLADEETDITLASRLAEIVATCCFRCSRTNAESSCGFHCSLRRKRAPCFVGFLRCAFVSGAQVFDRR